MSYVPNLKYKTTICENWLQCSWCLRQTGNATKGTAATLPMVNPNSAP